MSGAEDMTCNAIRAGGELDRGGALERAANSGDVFGQQSTGHHTQPCKLQVGATHQRGFSHRYRGGEDHHADCVVRLLVR